MPEDIGWQDGMQGFIQWVRKMDPTIKYRPLSERPANRTQWYWLEKFTWALDVLQADFDARNPDTAPPPPPPPPTTNPWDSGYAPQAYNRGSGGQNARFNIRINCTQRSDGKYVDKKGVVYSDSGLQESGQRSEFTVSGLKPSDMMDGLDPWEQYEWMGNLIGPNKENYPAASYNQ